jgi:hypothetical protein
VALAPRDLDVVSLREHRIREPVHGDTAFLSERTSDRHQSLLGERLKICLALPDLSGRYTSGEVSQYMRDEARWRVLVNVQALADICGILSGTPLEILESVVRPPCPSLLSLLISVLSRLSRRPQAQICGR